MNRNEFLEALPISRIVLKLTHAALEMYTDEIDDVHVMVSGADGDVKSLRITVSGNQLLVEQPAVSLPRNPVGSSWLQVTIRLPLTWKGRIEARTVTGWINARSLSGTELTLETVSGLINANAMLFQAATLRSVTGDIRLADLVCGKLALHSTSGAMTLQDGSFTHCSMGSITGSTVLGLRAPFESVTASSVIGDLAIDAPIDACNATLRSVSGSISTSSVSISPDAEASVLFSTVSGSLDISRSDIVS